VQGLAGDRITLNIFRWFRTHLLLVLIPAAVIALAPAYVHAYSIARNGISEVPTILAGDIVLANLAAYDLRLPYSRVRLTRLRSPVRGEMVVLRVPTSGWSAPKRVVGVPGDTVEIEENRVLVNGRSLSARALSPSEFAWIPGSNKMGAVIEEEEGHWISYTPGRSPNRNHPPTKVLKGQYFVLGDNRDESADSRIWGPVSEDLILGRVIAVLPTGPRN
jgi:signal peptidase I